MVRDTFFWNVYWWRPLPVLTLQKYPWTPLIVLKFILKCQWTTKFAQLMGKFWLQSSYVNVIYNLFQNKTESLISRDSRAKVGKLKKYLSLLSISVNLSWKLISVERWSQLKVNLIWKLISVENWSQLKGDLNNDLSFW